MKNTETTQAVGVFPIKNATTILVGMQIVNKYSFTTYQIKKIDSRTDEFTVEKLDDLTGNVFCEFQIRTDFFFKWDYNDTVKSSDKLALEAWVKMVQTANSPKEKECAQLWVNHYTDIINK
jgi:hypothetical protein